MSMLPEGFGMALENEISLGIELRGGFFGR
jgi:hypothetical protein